MRELHRVGFTLLTLQTLVGCPAASPTPASDAETDATGSSEPATIGVDGATEEGNIDTSVDADETGGGACAGTEASVRDTIIAPACATATCHDATTIAGGLDLSGDDLAASVVNVASGTCDGRVLVVPGDASGSLLVEKLGPSPTCGGPMPPTEALTSAEVACIEAWISTVDSSCETCGEPSCVDLQSSAQHCGDCGVACPEGVACQGGECACPTGTRACDGACVGTDSDPAHCGGCGRPCAADAFCLEGSCADDCAGLTECDGACVDLDTNPLHCGRCQMTCDAGETCSAAACGCDAPAVSYADAIEPFIVDRCASMGCHRPMGPNDGAADLDLSTGAGFDAMVGVASTQCANRLLVEPGSPATSYLNDKVLGVNLCSGTIMPKSGQGLSAAEKQSISDWICAGALP